MIWLDRSFRTMADALRIAVVGGGITGLAAAHAAAERARERNRPVVVTVLEQSKRFGGSLVTERLDGFLLDGGADSWVASKPQATALARGLGLSDSLVGTNRANRQFYVARGQKLHPVPEGFVLGVPTRFAPLARTRLFSWTGKARMALEPLVPVRRLDPNGDESIADFVTRRLGREAAERLVAPLLSGISSGDASNISVRAAFPQLVAMEQDHGSLLRAMWALRKGARARAPNESAFCSLRGGMGELTGALVERLRQEGVVLRTEAPVTEVKRAEGRWALAIAGAERLEADAVLLAIPAHAAAELLAPVDAGVAGDLRSIHYGSAATVFFAYRRADVAHPLDGVGFIVPRSPNRSILASTWVSSKWDDRAPEGSVLVRAFFGRTPGDATLAQSDVALARCAREDLRELMGLDAEPLFARVFRFDRASAQMRVGHLATMRAIHEGLARAAPGVRVAGGGYDGIGIPDCVRQGEEAGRAFVE